MLFNFPGCDVFEGKRSVLTLRFSNSRKTGLARRNPQHGLFKRKRNEDTSMTHLIVFGAQYLFAFVLIGAAAVVLKLPREWRNLCLKQAVIAGLLALVLTKVAGSLYFDPRPFTHGAPALIAHAPDNGFPSDHTVLCMTAALLAFTVSRRVGAVLLLFTALVALCRVLSGIHTPLDVVAGAVIGLLSFALALQVTRRQTQAKGAMTTNHD